MADLTGIFHQNSKGFGFVSLGDDEPELFIPKKQTAFAMEGDKVAVNLTKPANFLAGTAAEGEVVEILERGNQELVGYFQKFSKPRAGFIGSLKVRDKKISEEILVLKGGKVAEQGDLVEAELLAYPSAGQENEIFVQIKKVLGGQNEEGIDVLEILASLGIGQDFPQAVQTELKEVPSEVAASELVGREDFRNEIVFTIDGSDAKDLDDAVSIKKLENGHFELGVHIADVSHYVAENSAIDREAFERGTSVYVTDRVVPMLPEVLSNSICSLNPRLDRLTQSCIMEIDEAGQVVTYRICQSVIKTVERMTYDDVNLMLAGDEVTLTKYEEIKNSVFIMAELHHLLEKMRKKRGAIDFESDEAKIIVNETGIPLDIQPRKRATAERMIESFMLVANETVAQDFEKRGLPFIYRIHEEPKAERLLRFMRLAASFGLTIKGADFEALQGFIRSIKGKPAERVLSTQLLRAMQQAKYSEVNAGHYGLAAPAYTHFTSPIRRYPDLIVHRLIRALAQPNAESRKKWEESLPQIARQSSDRERRAVDAEREIEKIKKAEYMQQFIGQDFEGIISSVTKFGLFVSLENTVDGLIQLSSLKGQYFHYDERMLALIDEKSGQEFRIGQPIRVRLRAADTLTGDIDFEYLEEEL